MYEKKMGIRHILHLVVKALQQTNSTIMALSKPKGGHASLQGKKPSNTTKSKRKATNNPGQIRHKLKRSEMYGKYLLEKKASKGRKKS